MYFSEQISLITKKIIPDKIGNQKSEKVKRTIYCNQESVGQDEYYKAAQSGMSPKIRIVVRPYEYQEERLAEYNGKVYAVYRTFQRKPEELELYLTEKAGEKNGDY